MILFSYCDLTVVSDGWKSQILINNHLSIYLFRRGYADGEIEALFAKYDVDGDRVLDEGEQQKFQDDLRDEKVGIMFKLEHV